MPRKPIVLREFVRMKLQLLLMALLTHGFVAAAQSVPEPHVRFFNDSAKYVDFYVDGKFGCSMPANREGNLAYCDAEIGNGQHTVTIKGPRLSSQSCDLFVGEGTHGEANLSKDERFRCFGVRGLASPQRKIRPLRSDEPTQAAWQRWLDEDVRWIISPRERAAFLNLSNNEDRDRFIEEFWLRHDKEEHYQRIAYTNVHFGISANGGRTEAVPGWLTDRGRIYIAYGPPDSIKETGDTHVKSAILWHYPSIPAYGKDVELRFVDVCSCGDYRLETFPK